VADIGCGHGASTILMAQAFPKSTFVGFDYHGPSIEAARKAAQRAGVADRVSFEQAPAKAYPGRDYDLVAFFDCLHDMGDPVGAATHVLRWMRSYLSKDRKRMICEFEAADAEQVRASARAAGIAFDRCWSADLYSRDGPTASY